MLIKKFVQITLQVLFLSSIVSVVHAENLDSLSKIQQQLTQQAVLRGKFVQTKHLNLFSNPLVSMGNFTLAKDLGLIWDQTEPFPVQLILTQNKLIQSFPNAPAEVMTAQQNPMAFYFSSIFLSLFQGDSQSLEKEFDLTFTSGNPQWQLALIPKNEPLNKIFAKIEVYGNLYIDRISLIEVRKDRTDIEFVQQTHIPNTVTEKEYAQFNQ